MAGVARFAMGVADYRLRLAGGGRGRAPVGEWRCDWRGNGNA